MSVIDDQESPGIFPESYELSHTGSRADKKRTGILEHEDREDINIIVSELEQGYQFKATRTQDSRPSHLKDNRSRQQDKKVIRLEKGCYEDLEVVDGLPENSDELEVYVREHLDDSDDYTEFPESMVELEQNLGNYIEERVK